MLDISTAAMLAKYNDWADRVLWDAIKKLPEAAVSQERKTLFGSLIGTLNHLYQVDAIWRAHILGEEHGFTTRRDLLYPDFEVLIQKQLEMNQWYLDWAREQTPESLKTVVNFNYVSGAPARMHNGGMFLHIINHKTYHRGWVSQMFFDHGVNPPETDLCVYLSEHEES